MRQLPIYPRYVTALDMQFHFEDRESSSVKSIEQDFDCETLEHVITIEYRVKVPDAPDPRIRQEHSERGLRARKEIMDVWRDCLRPMLDKYPDLDKYM
ncbi:hypothetical protein [Herminiimonas arsenitoxidans]|uniref:hypothetical protein n=1 Tax=Herminiimonas arsenitoxidans TaxID=1809410 RepID=UPI00097056C7|nr:hypothetical protein [Herminiimonas arsenitoxidans]